MVKLRGKGFTLVEVLISVVVLMILVVTFTNLLVSLIHSTMLTRQKNQALILATNQLETLKAKSYEELEVNSPTSEAKTIDNTAYTIKSEIYYVDDAYDGCGNYPTQQLKEAYCRNYPPPASAPSQDSNPSDYKLAKVSVSIKTAQLATLDTYLAPRVSETASSTGALFVSVISPSGTPIDGATVSVDNNSASPAVHKSGTTDSNGVVIFYGLEPDNHDNYIVSASKTGYSSLQTIGSSGSVQATYANQHILTQSSSYTTLTIAPQSQYSLLIETTDTSGDPLGNAKIYLKGGYKKYVVTDDTRYYYDNLSPADNRVTTDSNGLAAVTDLPPINQYIFCGDDGAASCLVGGTHYYLAAALPYNGDSSFNPVTVPPDDSTSSGNVYVYGGHSYVQKVRLMLTTSSAYPRVFTISPTSVSTSDSGLSNFSLTVDGYNLNSASLTLKQGSTSYSGSSCSSSAKQISCQFNLSGLLSSSNLRLIVTNGAGTLSLPASSPRGGLIVTP